MHQSNIDSSTCHLSLHVPGNSCDWAEKCARLVTLWYQNYVHRPCVWLMSTYSTDSLVVEHFDPEKNGIKRSSTSTRITYPKSAKIRFGEKFLWAFPYYTYFLYSFIWICLVDIESNQQLSDIVPFFADFN